MLSRSRKDVLKSSIRALQTLQTLQIQWSGPHWAPRMLINFPRIVLAAGNCDALLICRARDVERMHARTQSRMRDATRHGTARHNATQHGTARHESTRHTRYPTQTEESQNHGTQASWLGSQSNSPPQPLIKTFSSLLTDITALAKLRKC